MMLLTNTEESMKYSTDCYNTRMREKGLNPGIRMRLLSWAESILSSMSQGLWWIGSVLLIQTLRTYRRGPSLLFSQTTKKSTFTMQMLRTLREGLWLGMRMISKCLQISKRAQTRIRSLRRAYLIKEWMKSVKKNAKLGRQSCTRPTISRGNIISQDAYTAMSSTSQFAKLEPLSKLILKHILALRIGKKT